MHCKQVLYTCNRAKAEQLGTWFVGVFCHPSYGDPPDLRVAESQQEGAVWFGQQHVLCLLLVYKAQNGPTNTHIYTLKHLDHCQKSNRAHYCPHSTMSAAGTSKTHLKVTVRQINETSRGEKQKRLPIIPVWLKMFLHELHDSIKPLPEGEVAPR